MSRVRKNHRTRSPAPPRRSRMVSNHHMVGYKLIYFWNSGSGSGFRSEVGETGQTDLSTRICFPEGCTRLHGRFWVQKIEFNPTISYRCWWPSNPARPDMFTLVSRSVHFKEIGFYLILRPMELNWILISSPSKVIPNTKFLVKILDYHSKPKQMLFVQIFTDKGLSSSLQHLDQKSSSTK